MTNPEDCAQTVPGPRPFRALAHATEPKRPETTFDPWGQLSWLEAVM
jgi:hypothetical protein